MAVSNKHKFTDPSTELPPSGVDRVGPDEWNDEHNLTLTGPALLGKATSGDGDAAEIPLDADGALAANSDGKVATQKAVKTYADTKQAALGFTAENVANKDTTTTLGTSDTAYPSQKAVKTYVDDHIPKGYIFDLTLSNNGSDATNDIDIAAGEAADRGAADIMVLAASITKRTDAAWAVGSGNGGLDTGSIDNGTIHHFLIKRPDTGVVDVLQSLTPDRSGVVTMTIASPCVVTLADHGLQAGSRFQFTTTGALPTGVSANTDYYVLSTSITTSTFRFSATQGGSAVNSSGSQSGVHTLTASPLMPSNYTLRRRIGSLLRKSGALVAFTQFGDDFRFGTKILEMNVSTAQTDALVAFNLPVGIKVNMHSQGAISANTCTDSALAVGHASEAATSIVIGRASASGTPIVLTAIAAVWSNRSAQCRRSLAIVGGTIFDAQIYNLGYIDQRDRLFTSE